MKIFIEFILIKVHLQKEVKKCNFKQHSKKIARQLQVCKAEFSACKKYEDESIPVISYCAVSEEKLLAAAKLITSKLSMIDMAMNKSDRIKENKEMQKIYVTYH